MVPLVTQLRDISTSVNSTITSGAAKTWQVMTNSRDASDTTATASPSSAQVDDDPVDTTVKSADVPVEAPITEASEMNEEDDLLTPRPKDNNVDSQFGSLSVHDDYFTNTARSRTYVDGAATPGPIIKPTLERLQSKATTALSLREAHANDAGSSSGAAVPTSEASSIRSLVPTMNSGDNDVEGMLGEILSEENVRFSGSKGNWSLSQEEEEEDSEEEWDVEEGDDLDEEERIAVWRARRKHFFILSSAGKPVYSRYGDEQVVIQFMGVIQTIISFFQDGDDPLRSFTAGKHRFAILQEGFLYLVAISSMGETDAQLRTQLDALYTQVISTLTLTTVSKVFKERENFDLRRLLGGTEVFLDGLSDAMLRGDPNVLLGALECVKLRKQAREKINSVLLKCRTPSLLYGLIIADGRLVSVVRPKRHSLHPPDLQLFISMLFNANTFRGGGEHWTPMCLPKFNSKGFLHAYICFFKPEIALVLISPGRDSFFEMKEVKEKIVDQLVKDGSVEVIEAAVKRGRYLTTDAVAGSTLRHFLYKSKANVQYTMPSFDTYYSSPIARRRLMTLYQRLHATVHAKNAHLKVHHNIRTTSVSLAWVTPTFELYCIAGANVARNVLAQNANAVLSWVKKEEERLFIVGGATF